MPSIIQTGRTLRLLPYNSASTDFLEQAIPLIKHIGLLEQARKYRFSYEVEWRSRRVSIDYYCMSKAWTKKQLEHRKNMASNTLETFLESTGILKRFQRPLEDRLRWSEIISKSPFMYVYDNGLASWSRPLHIRALIGRPIVPSSVEAGDLKNNLIDQVLKYFGELDIHYGLLQVIFRGYKPLRISHTGAPSLNKQFSRSTTPQKLLKQQKEKGYRHSKSFVAEIRLLVIDFEYDRIKQLQDALTPVMQQYGLQISPYPCWYKFKRLSTVLKRIRARKPIKWQPLSGEHLAQLIGFPQHRYTGLKQLPSRLMEPKLPPKIQTGILIGHPFTEGIEIQEPYYLSLEALSSHLSIWGGMGKSRFVYGLILELAKQGYPITVLDPKGEYVDLVDDLEDVTILRPGSKEFPFHLNILEVPPNLTDEDHLEFLHDTIVNIFHTQETFMEPQVEAVLNEALRYAISNRLTFGKLLNILEYPENELITHIELRRANLKTAAHAIANHLRELTFGVAREIFLGKTTIPIQKLLNHYYVIDLSKFEIIENVNARKFFLEMFSHYLLNHLQTNYQSTHKPGQIEHVLLINEIQKLAPRASSYQGLLGKLTWMLRGYGVAVIYSGTEPIVQSSIRNNIGTTIVFHSEYQPDVLANLLGIQRSEYLDYREAQNLLGPSQYALISQKDQDGVFMLKVKDVSRKVPAPLKAQKFKEKPLQKSKDQYQPEETKGKASLDSSPDFVPASSLIAASSLSPKPSGSTIQTSNMSINNKSGQLSHSITSISHDSVSSEKLEQDRTIKKEDIPPLEIPRKSKQAAEKDLSESGKFWFGKREAFNKRSQIEEKRMPSQRPITIGNKSVVAYEKDDKTSFSRKLEKPEKSVEKGTNLEKKVRVPSKLPQFFSKQELKPTQEHSKKEIPLIKQDFDETPPKLPSEDTPEDLLSEETEITADPPSVAAGILKSIEAIAQKHNRSVEIEEGYSFTISGKTKKIAGFLTYKEIRLGIDVPSVKSFDQKGGIAAYHTLKRLCDIIKVGSIDKAIIIVPPETGGVKYEALLKANRNKVNVFEMNEKEAEDFIRAGLLKKPNEKGYEVAKIVFPDLEKLKE
ncbi:MAG: helicase HerA domain-containing protein [Promethearchaeota archaeon]